MPLRVRPSFPRDWEVTEDPKLWVTWVQADEKLAKEEVYWVSTSSSDRGPHAVPVWGIWDGRRFYFETDPGSVKGRDLVGDPRVVVHLQDGKDTVIVEGIAARFTKAKKMELLRQGYVAKYGYKPDWSDETRQVVFEVVPKVAHAWRVPRMHQSLVNFVF